MVWQSGRFVLLVLGGSRGLIQKLCLAALEGELLSYILRICLLIHGLSQRSVFSFFSILSSFTRNKGEGRKR